MNKKVKFEPNITDIKILVTVSYLNDLGLYPLHDGVLKILKGQIDNETISLQDCPTFQTLLSYSSKQIARRVMMLLRYDYLNKKYDPNTNELYLSITIKGKTYLINRYKNKEMKFSKKEIKNKMTIVKI